MVTQHKISRLIFTVFLLAITDMTVLADGTSPQSVTAAWSNSHHLDLFTVNKAGQIVSTWWDGACGWQLWFSIRPETALAAPGQSVTAVWSNPNHLDLFMSAADGTVKSTWWEANPPAPLQKGLHSWFSIGSAHLAAPGQSVTAVWSNPNHLDLFMSAADGTVKSTWWEAN